MKSPHTKATHTMNLFFSTKRRISSVLSLGGGLLGLLLVAAPGVLSVGTQGGQEAGGLRLLGGLLLVVSMVLALCAWAANGRRQQLPSAGESPLGDPPVGKPDRYRPEVVEPGATPDDVPAADRWQVLPWVPLIVVALSVAAYVMLDQISVGMSVATRDKLRLPPVLLCALSWPVAASTAVICLIRALVRKARGGATRDLASPLVTAVFCGLSFPVWLLAMMMILQTASWTITRDVHGSILAASISRGTFPETPDPLGDRIARYRVEPASPMGATMKTKAGTGQSRGRNSVNHTTL